MYTNQFLQPENLMVDIVNLQTKLKLVDFGDARCIEANSQYVHKLIGSPEFMAPEIISGLPVTLAADIWWVCLYWSVMTHCVVYLACHTCRVYSLSWHTSMVYHDTCMVYNYTASYDTCMVYHDSWHMYFDTCMLYDINGLLWHMYGLSWHMYGLLWHIWNLSHNFTHIQGLSWQLEKYYIMWSIMTHLWSIIIYGYHNRCMVYRDTCNLPWHMYNLPWHIIYHGMFQGCGSSGLCHAQWGVPIPGWQRGRILPKHPAYWLQLSRRVLCWYLSPSTRLHLSHAQCGGPVRDYFTVCHRMQLAPQCRTYWHESYSNGIRLLQIFESYPKYSSL